MDLKEMLDGLSVTARGIVDTLGIDPHVNADGSSELLDNIRATVSGTKDALGDSSLVYNSIDRARGLNGPAGMLADLLLPSRPEGKDSPTGQVEPDPWGQDIVSGIVGAPITKAARAAGRGLSSHYAAREEAKAWEGILKKRDELEARLVEADGDFDRAIEKQLMELDDRAASDFPMRYNKLHEEHKRNYFTENDNWHGSSARYSRIDESKGDPQGLFGEGYYTTNHRGVAEGYQGVHGDEEHLYNVKVRAANPFIIDNNIDNDSIDRIIAEADKFKNKSTPIVKKYQEILNAVDTKDVSGELYDRILAGDTGSVASALGIDEREIRNSINNAYAISGNFPNIDIAQQSLGILKDNILDKKRVFSNEDLWNTLRFDPLTQEGNHPVASPNEILKSLGYDSIKHKGGGRVGNIDHMVTIALRPENVRSVHARLSPFLRKINHLYYGIAPLATGAQLDRDVSK